jgi:predicted secreted protein
MLNALSIFAVYFVIWWLVLFAVLPFGVRTQAENQDITLGTTESAPSLPRMGRAVLITTFVSLLITGAFYGLTAGLGYSFDDIPRIIPDFG